jgi:hypothetical protein
MASVQAIDYTNKDYASLRRAMLELARYRLPEWTDRSPSDLGVLLVDLFAYMGDIVLYYQDRIANECFLQTAVERRSVVNLLRLIGYELSPPAPAAVELTLVFNVPAPGASTIATIPNGAQFGSDAKAPGGRQIFEYQGPTLTIDLSSDQVAVRPDGKRAYRGLPLLQSAAQPTVVLGSSTGEPNQLFAIPSRPVILDTLVVEVNEGAGWVPWTRRGSLLYEFAPDGRVSFSSADARDYYVQFDEEDVCRVHFGDGVYGGRPPAGTNNIRATYRVGGGASGNVPANAITTLLTPIPLLGSVTNPYAAAGGADHENVGHAKQFGPLTFRSGQRAVTLSDYVALAHQAGGVAKVRAAAPSWNVIQLYVAPEGDTLRPVPEELRRRLVSYFEDKRMAGTFVEILSAAPVPIDVGLEVVFDRRYRADAVRQAVDVAVRDLLAFRSVDFGQPLYLSDLYATVEDVPGVAAMTVTRFRRRDSQAAAQSDEMQAGLRALAVNGSSGVAGVRLTESLQALLQRAMQVDVATDGRVDILEFEIPEVGTLEIQLVESTR